MHAMNRRKFFFCFFATLILTALAGCALRPRKVAAPPEVQAPATMMVSVTQAPVAERGILPSEPSRSQETPTPDLTALDLQTSVDESSDRRWRAEASWAVPVVGGESYFRRLVVTSADGKTRHVVQDGWAHFGAGYTIPRPFQWSADGKSLYFTAFPVVDGCAPYVNGSDLQRLNLASGQVEQLLPGGGLWLALAPDETRLAYIGTGGRGLVVRDLAFGQERALSLGASDPAGAIVWSPDGQWLTLTLMHNPCREVGTSTSILQVGVSDLQAKTLLERDPRQFETAEWPRLDQLLLRDPGGNGWSMRLPSGAIDGPIIFP